MTAFLGLGVMACGDESIVDESNNGQPEVALVDNANIDKGEKGAPSVETVKEQEPEKSDATDPEKETQSSVSEVVESETVKDKDKEFVDKPVKEKPPAEAAPVKIPGGGLTGLTMDRPGRPVGAKYGMPSVSTGSSGPKGRVRIGAVSTDDCDSTYTQKIFRKYSSQLRMCYDIQLKQAPTLETTIDVEIDILKGRVSAVSIERNEATGDASGSEALGQCVQKKMKRWKFPQECTGTVQGIFSFKNVK